MELLKATWIQPPDSERWLVSMIRGSSINVCCGKSLVGDVRLDLLKPPRANSTETGDLFKARDKFGRESFDTVICDPPFNYYFRGAKWIHALGDMARKRLILSVNHTIVRLGSQWSKEYYCAEEDGTFYLRLWEVFDRKDTRLSASYLPEEPVTGIVVSDAEDGQSRERIMLFAR